mgnify:CR=1
MVDEIVQASWKQGDCCTEEVASSSLVDPALQIRHKKGKFSLRISLNEVTAKEFR